MVIAQELVGTIVNTIIIKEDKEDRLGSTPYRTKESEMSFHVSIDTPKKNVN
jgi:hypothetical protein